MPDLNTKIDLEHQFKNRINKVLSEKKFEWDLKELLVYNIEFPEDKYPSERKSYEGNGNFNEFLKKINWLLNLQFYYSIKVIKQKKRQSLVYFLRMYLTTQKETIQNLHDMYYELTNSEQKLVYDYIDIPRLEEEIQGVNELLSNQWNRGVESLSDKETESFSDKEMLGIVEEVSDSVKEPMKRVFGGAGNWVNENILRRHPDHNEKKWSAKHQGKINSGFKYLDEFGNIGIRMARGGF